MAIGCPELSVIVLPDRAAEVTDKAPGYEIVKATFAVGAGEAVTVNCVGEASLQELEIEAVDVVNVPTTQSYEIEYS